MNKFFLASLVLAAVVAVPSLSLAATYAYVNTAGEVMTVESADWQTAIRTAPSIHPRSGVMLIENDEDREILD